MKDNYRFLKLEGKEIVGWAQYFVSEEHSSYFPSHLLLFIKRGILNFRVAEKVNSFTAPAYVLVRKNTLGFFRKTWAAHEGQAEVFVLLLRDDFIQSAIKNLGISAPVPSAQVPGFCGLERNEDLEAIFANLPRYFLGEKAFTTASVRTVTERVIRGCLAANPSLIHMFSEVFTPIGQHVKHIVDHYFDGGLNVVELADMAGLSLSSFYREFHKEFGDSPHRWLMNRRLQLAYELLKNSDKSITNVAYQTGFKDTSHFSRRFKKHFGYPPSRI